jgi:hypothetical protein
MNIVELDEPLRGKPRWTKFAAKLEKAMTEEYRLDGVAVFLRELRAEEELSDNSELLTFSQERQRFEFAVGPAVSLPAAWKIADRIDGFLNPNP